MAKDVDEAVSESSWTALAMVKEKDWWSIDSKVKWRSWKSQVSCPGLKGGSVDPIGKMGHNRSARTKIAREERKAERSWDGNR